MDLLFSRGSSLERWHQGTNPTPVLYRNRGDGTFEDVTQKAGLLRGGWGVGVTRRRLRQRRLGGPLPDQPRPGRAVPQQRRRHLHRRHREGRHPRPGLELLGRVRRLRRGRVPRPLRGRLPRRRAPTSSPRDAPAAPAPTSARPSCAARAACPGAQDLCFHNNGDGTFTERSEASGAFDKERYFGLGVVDLGRRRRRRPRHLRRQRRDAELPLREPRGRPLRRARLPERAWR